MFYLKKCENVIPLKNLININKKKDGTIITFDDGFKNNYNVAYKILKKYNLPATFFICPGMISKKKLFWVDLIESYINQTKIKKFTVYLKKKHIFETHSIKAKIFTCEQIKKYCKNINNREKDTFIKNLKKRLKIKNLKINKKIHETLSWNDLNIMIKNNKIDIGLHSFKHEILSMLEKKELKKNIKKSLNLIYNKTKVKTILAAYPEGQKNHYNNNIIKNLKNFGIKICPTAIKGQNANNTNLFFLGDFARAESGASFFSLYESTFCHQFSRILEFGQFLNRFY